MALVSMLGTKFTRTSHAGDMPSEKLRHEAMRAKWVAATSKVLTSLRAAKPASADPATVSFELASESSSVH